MNKAASIISVLGHPFVLLPLTILLATLNNASPARALTIAAITVLVTVVPLFLIIRRKVSAGKWSDYDISEPSERRSFYPFAAAAVALSCLVFWLLDFPRPLLIGVIISLFLLLAAMLINRFSKISLHLIFAAYCAMSLTAVSFWTASILIALAIAVGWSRVVLKRHTLAQVLGGAALGLIGGLFLLRIIALF
jgi:membrane-associated phospholipid phosphatase